MAWVWLLLAGLMEVCWPVGLKVAQDADGRVRGVLLAVGGMGLSGFFLWLSQRGNAIPMGTAYAVWTGIGAVGAFLVGLVFYAEDRSALRFVSVALIVLGLVGLKLSHRPPAAAAPVERPAVGAGG